MENKFKEKYGLKLGDVIYLYQIDTFTGTIIKRLSTVVSFQPDLIIVMDEGCWDIGIKELDVVDGDNFATNVERDEVELKMIFESALCTRRQDLDEYHKKEIKKLDKLIDKLRK